MRRGSTLIELLVGIATAAIIATVCAKVLQLGVMTYNQAVNQTESLTRTRKAIAGDGARFGMMWAGRGAYTFSAILASSATVVSTSSIDTSFYLAGGNLYRNKAGSGVLQADGISSLALNYYNLNSSGLIIESTAAVSATMMTALVTVQNNKGTKKTYTLFSGALLRNHP